MKKFLIVSIVLAFVAHSATLKAGNEDAKEPSSSEISISGTVTDGYTGESLNGVAVSLEGTEKSVYTDFEGKFRFAGLTPGDYTLKTVYISYQESSSKIKAKPDDKNEIVVKLTSMAN
jgi:hypothetical protein